MGHVSVPLLAVMLSHRLSVIALVSRYLTNKLIERRPILKRQRLLFVLYRTHNCLYARTIGNYPTFRLAMPVFRVCTYVLLTRLPLSQILRFMTVWLACLIHAASAHPEPGSNSQNKSSRKIYGFRIDSKQLKITDINFLKFFPKTQKIRKRLLIFSFQPLTYPKDKRFICNHIFSFSYH